MTNIDIGDFINKNQLPSSYQQHAEQWFFELAEQLFLHQSSAKKTLVIGINGAQGSGKSTLAELLVFIFTHHFKLNAINLSLDDFYLTRAERAKLATSTHPMLQTRGVPGTHDVSLAYNTIKDLQNNKLPVAITRFDKAIDDRQPTEKFDLINESVDIILFEGWCLGAEAEEAKHLTTPVNALEATHDKDATWRHYVNKQLAEHYPSLFNLVDMWIMLKAPSFNCVRNWRLEQEDKLRQKAGDKNHVMTAEQVEKFIMFYQRITENTLKSLPSKVHYLYELDDTRQIINMKTKPFTLDSMNKDQWLVFTDMDGSLLDHHTYQFDAAIPSLNMLKQHNIPVIPVTSKTQSEVEMIRESLDNKHPFIIENGAAVFIPKFYFKTQPKGTIESVSYWIKEFVKPRKQWQQLIEQVRPRYKKQFISFDEAGIDGIIAMTGLNVHSAARAAKRQYGEPIAWQGNDKTKQQFISELTQLGAHVLAGGRFLHVSGKCDKGLALQWLVSVFQQNTPNQQVSTLAIGDSQNDIAMLELADQALVIRSPVHEFPILNRKQNVLFSKGMGPEGWAEGINKLITNIAS